PDDRVSAQTIHQWLANRNGSMRTACSRRYCVWTPGVVLVLVTFPMHMPVFNLFLRGIAQSNHLYVEVQRFACEGMIEIEEDAVIENVSDVCLGWLVRLFVIDINGETDFQFHTFREHFQRRNMTGFAVIDAVGIFRFHNYVLLVADGHAVQTLL